MDKASKKTIIITADNCFRHLLEKALILHDINSVLIINTAQNIPDHNHVITVLNQNDKIEITASEKDVFYLPVRMGALLDRINKYSSKIKRRDNIFISSYHLKLDEGMLTDKHNNNFIRLTEKERDILLSLYNHNGKVVSHKKLLEDVWGYASDLETHTLETHIYRLRQKIEKDPAHPLILLTDEAGYRLADQDFSQ